MAENPARYKPLYIFILQLARHQCLANHGYGVYLIKYNRDDLETFIEIKPRHRLDGDFNERLFFESFKKRIEGIPDRKTIGANTLDMILRLERAIADEVSIEYHNQLKMRDLAIDLIASAFD